MQENEKDWKLKLRYGRSQTKFTHFTIIADGKVLEENETTQTRPGPAVIGLKCWAGTYEEGLDMLYDLGQRFGFQIEGKVEYYTSDPKQPPGQAPSCYDLNFTPFED